MSKGLKGLLRIHVRIGGFSPPPIPGLAIVTNHLDLLARRRTPRVILFLYSLWSVKIRTFLEKEAKKLTL